MFAATHKATLRLKHKPGEQMQVDWVGDTLSISDPVTGGTMKAYVFVACLPCSMYGYAEAFPDMKTPSWLAGHIHAFEFFGGVPMLEPGENDHSGGCFKRALTFITKSISTVQLPLDNIVLQEGLRTFINGAIEGYHHDRGTGKTYLQMARRKLIQTAYRFGKGTAEAGY